MIDPESERLINLAIQEKRISVAMRITGRYFHTFSPFLVQFIDRIIELETAMGEMSQTMRRISK